MAWRASLPRAWASEHRRERLAAPRHGPGVAVDAGGAAARPLRAARPVSFLSRRCRCHRRDAAARRDRGHRDRHLLGLTNLLVLVLIARATDALGGGGAAAALCGLCARRGGGAGKAAGGGSSAYYTSNVAEGAYATPPL